MTTEGRFFIFANPSACGGLTRERHSLIQRLAHRLGGELSGTEAKSNDDFLDIVEKTVSDGDWAIFAGDATTFHDGLNCLYRQNVTLGFIPFVPGNGLARGLSIPAKPTEDQLFEILSRGRVLRADLIKVSTPILEVPEVALFASVGWCAMVTNEQQGQGLLDYLGPAMRSIIGEFYEQDTTVIIDGRNVWADLNTFIVVSKIPYCGATLKVVPDAILDDGYLHLAICHLSRTEMASLHAKSFAGLTHQPDVARPGRRVKIKSSGEDLPLQIDGEYIGQTEEILCEVLSGAVRILTGEVMDGQRRRRPSLDEPEHSVEETGRMSTSAQCGHCQHAILGGEVFRCTKCATLYHAHCWQNFSRCSNGICGSVICDIVRIAQKKNVAPETVFDIEEERGEEKPEGFSCRHCGNPIDSYSLPCPFCGSMP